MSATLAQERVAPGFAGWIVLGARSLMLLVWLLLMLPLFALLRPFYRRNPIPRLFFRGVNRILGLRVRRHGRAAARSFLVANHVSWLDIPGLCEATGTAFIANDELLEHGWLHWLCRLNDTVFVARRNRASVASQIDDVRDAISGSKALTIFAEGTTSDGTGIAPFKSSLLAALSPVPAGLAVHPVLLEYGRDTAHAAWVGDEPGKDSYIRIASQLRPIRLDVHILPPLSIEQMGDRKTMAASVREVLLAAKAEARQRVAL